MLLFTSNLQSINIVDNFNVYNIKLLFTIISIHFLMFRINLPISLNPLLYYSL